MNVRNYFIQEWQIYSKWCASSNCSRLPGVCAEKNMGAYRRLSGKKCHDWFLMSATGTYARYLPTLTWFSPTMLQLGTSMLGDLKRIAQKHTAWCWQRFAKSPPLLTPYLVLLAEPRTLHRSSHGKPAKSLFLCESLSDLVFLLHISYAHHLSKVLWRGIQCEILACNYQYSSSVKVSVEELLGGTCSKWLMGTKFWCWDW